MSIDRVKVTRTMIVDSPIHFWRLLKNKNEILQLNSHLNIFCYQVDKYIDGCRCDDELNRKVVEDEYELIKNTPTLIDFIKKQFGCNSVIFLDNEWK